VGAAGLSCFDQDQGAACSQGSQGNQGSPSSVNAITTCTEAGSKFSAEPG
jgi:hypothetical protein